MLQSVLRQLSRFLEEEIRSADLLHGVGALGIQTARVLALSRLPLHVSSLLQRRMPRLRCGVLFDFDHAASHARAFSLIVTLPGSTAAQKGPHICTRGF